MATSHTTTGRGLLGAHEARLPIRDRPGDEDEAWTHCTRRKALPARVGRGGRMQRHDQPTRGSQPLQTVAYGTDPSQFADLHLPTSTDRSSPSWWSSMVATGDRGTGSRSALRWPPTSLATGWRRGTSSTGGWETVAAGQARSSMSRTRWMPCRQGECRRSGRLDLAKVVTLGHSAGGQLAAWLAARHKLALRSGRRCAGCQPDRVRVAGRRSRSGRRYERARGRRCRCAHGWIADGAVEALCRRVPVRAAAARRSGHARPRPGDARCPSAERRVAAKAKQVGDDVAEVRMAGVDHFMLIDPSTPAWGSLSERGAWLRPAGVGPEEQPEAPDHREQNTQPDPRTNSPTPPRAAGRGGNGRSLGLRRHTGAGSSKRKSRGPATPSIANSQNHPQREANRRRSRPSMSRNATPLATAAIELSSGHGASPPPRRRAAVRHLPVVQTAVCGRQGVLQPGQVNADLRVVPGLPSELGARSCRMHHSEQIRLVPVQPALGPPDRTGLVEVLHQTRPGAHAGRR